MNYYWVVAINSKKRPWAKWLAWVTFGLLSPLLVLSPYFWVIVAIFVWAFLRWIGAEFVKMVEKGLRATFKTIGNIFKKLIAPLHRNGI